MTLQLNGAVAGLLFASAAAGQAPIPSGSSAFPGAAWDRVSVPESVGFSSAGLAFVSQYLRSTAAALPKRSPGAVMVIAGGKVLLDYGDTAKVSYIASVRKSVLAMLFGKYVETGKIHLGDTLADLGIDDVGGLLASERQATVADLMASRSGVYHESANGWDGWSPPAPRGSQPHGTYFLYNNWGFNVLGTIFETVSRQNIYDALEHDLARPIGMQDFRRDLQKKEGDPAQSKHPAYHMRLSTRDMARIGYLMLREGNWDGAQVIPKAWVHKITTPTTRLEEMNPKSSISTRRWGYGYMWWTFDEAACPPGSPLRGAYTAAGAYGQYITVIPKLDVVIAQKTPADSDLTDWDYLRFVDVLVAAACDPCTAAAPRQ